MGDCLALECGHRDRDGEIPVRLHELALLRELGDGERRARHQILLLPDAGLALVHAERPAAVEDGKDAVVEEAAELAVVLGQVGCGGQIPRVVEV